VANQHIRGIEILLREEPYGLSIAPLARSIAEASGRAAWLLDNRLATERKRVARLFLDEEENARRYKVLAYALETDDRAKAGERYAQARNAIRKPGIFYPSEIVVDERGLVELAKESLPGPSSFAPIAAEIFGTNEKEANTSYSLLSSMTHPTLFALLGMLVDPDDLEPNAEVIPLREDDLAVKTVVCNAINDFHNGWRAWMSWVAGTDIEVGQLLAVYQRIAEHD